MPESLEAMLSDDESSGDIGETGDSFNVSKYPEELDKALNERSFYAKSNLTNRNLRGILRGNAWQEYLYGKYGFRIKVLDNLIMDKCEGVLSIEGKGRKEFIDIVSKGTMKIEAKSGFDYIDKAFGSRPR